MKSLLRFLIILTAASLFFVACKKNLDATNEFPELPQFDLTTRVSASASGFVTDENDEPVRGAAVKAGNSTSTTNQYGHFEFNNVSLVKEAAVISVDMPGYFKGIKTFIVNDGRTAFFRIKLIPKRSGGTIDANGGGSVTLPDGLSVTLPAAGVKIASSNAMYSGPVYIALHWIDPSSTDVHSTMPGDLRGINTSGSMKLLTTYGMAAVELTGASGELLQVADGKKATVTFPLPPSMVAAAPASIPLWYFDETAGLWKEEGAATKNGNTYIGDVSHFSFWNCDMPDSYVLFTATVKTAANIPAAYATVKISEVANPGNARFGSTDINGFVSGPVPDNRQLKLEVLAPVLCVNTAIFSQLFTTGVTPYAAGDIILPLHDTLVAQISGTVTDCSNNPVTSGYVMVNMGGQYTQYPLDLSGSYQIITVLCSSTVPASIMANDPIGMHHSLLMNYLIVDGPNLLGNIQTCDTSLNAYDGRYSLNGYHNRLPYTFPYINIAMELRELSPNLLSIYWPEMADYGHPIGVAPGQTSWYGNNIAPVILIDPSTNIITDVFNGSGGTPISLMTGAPTSHYDVASGTLYVYWMYNNNPLRGFIDTFRYLGPR